MKYIYAKHPSKLSTLMIAFGAGARVENGVPNGIAHVMEHMRFKGTKDKNSKQLSGELAIRGGSWNAYTSSDIVAYYASIPEENLETACSVLSDVVLRPEFPEDELVKELDVICQEIRMYDDDIYSLARDAMFKMAFKNNLRVPIIGYEKTVKQITRQDLIDFNSKFYNHDQMCVILAAPNNHKKLITSYFGKDDGVLNLKPKAKSVEYGKGKSKKIIKEGLVQSTVVIGYGSPDIYKVAGDEAKVEMFNNIFGCGEVSRLFSGVREDLGLVYGISSNSVDTLDGSLFTIATLTDPKNVKKVVGAIDKEIKRITTEPPTKEELETAKSRFKSTIYSVFDRSSGCVSNVITEVMLGSKPVKEIIKEVDKVKPQDILNVAKTIFSGNKYTVIGTGKGE